MQLLLQLLQLFTVQLLLLLLLQLLLMMLLLLQLLPVIVNFFFFVKEFFIANFYPEKELGGYHNFIMPHCLLLPRNNSLFIINNHAGIILFVIDFRIVDADSSNCDFTIRFLIRVHGLPPGSFNPSSVIVLVRNLDTGESVSFLFFSFFF